MPIADREPTDAEDMIFNLSLASRDKSAHSILRSREAKDKGKDRIGPRAGPTLNRAHPASVKGAEGALKARDNPPKKRGSATNIIGKLRPEFRRTRSGDYLRRTHSAKVLMLPRGGKVITKKRQGTEQSTQEAASTATDLATSLAATEAERNVGTQKVSSYNSMNFQLDPQPRCTFRQC